MGVIYLAGELPAGYPSAVPTFGERLRVVRESLTPPVRQDELARRLGHANNSTISKWERSGKLPDVETIKKVADALKVAPSALLIGVPDPYDTVRDLTAGKSPSEGKGNPQKKLGNPTSIVASPDPQSAFPPADREGPRGEQSHRAISAESLVVEIRTRLESVIDDVNFLGGLVTAPRVRKSKSVESGGAVHQGPRRRAQKRVRR